MQYGYAQEVWYKFLHDKNIYHKFMDEYIRANPLVKGECIVEVLRKELKSYKVETWFISTLSWVDTRDGFTYWSDINTEWYTLIRERKNEFAKVEKALETEREKQKKVIATKLDFFEFLLEADLFDEFFTRLKGSSISKYLDSCEPSSWVSSAFPWGTEFENKKSTDWAKIESLWIEKCE